MGNRRAAVVDDQPVLTEAGRVMDKAIGALETVRVPVTDPLNLTLHFLTAMRVHKKEPPHFADE